MNKSLKIAGTISYAPDVTFDEFEFINYMSTRSQEFALVQHQGSSTEHPHYHFYSLTDSTVDTIRLKIKSLLSSCSNRTIRLKKVQQLKKWLSYLYHEDNAITLAYENMPYSQQEVLEFKNDFNPLTTAKYLTMKDAPRHIVKYMEENSIEYYTGYPMNMLLKSMMASGQYITHHLADEHYTERIRFGVEALLSSSNLNETPRGVGGCEASFEGGLGGCGESSVPREGMAEPSDTTTLLETILTD